MQLGLHVGKSLLQILVRGRTAAANARRGWALRVCEAAAYLLGALDAFDPVAEGITQLLLISSRAPIEIRLRGRWLHSLLWAYALPDGASLGPVCRSANFSERAVVVLLISNLILEPVLEPTAARVEQAVRAAASRVHGVAHGV